MAIDLPPGPVILSLEGDTTLTAQQLHDDVLDAIVVKVSHIQINRSGDEVLVSKSAFFPE